MSLSRTNVALLAVALALAAVVVADALRGRPRLPDEVVWPAILVEEVDTLRVSNAAGEVRLHREAHRWLLDAPVAAPADPDLVRAVLRTFDEPLRPDVRVTAAADDPATYGFVDGERVEIEIGQGGARVFSLELGRALPGGSTFLRAPGDTAVYRARLAGRYRLEKPPTAWRDHRLLGMTRGKVVAMTLEGPDATWHLERRTEDWACLETPEQLLDARLVEGMARSLADLRAVALLDEVPPDAFADVPLRVTAIDSDRRIATVEFGAATPDGGRHVRVGERLGVVAEARYQTFLRRPDELLERDITRLDWRELERVTVIRGEQRFAAVPVGDRAWQLVEPAGYSLDARELGFSLDALVKLRAFEVLAADDPRAAGLDDPAAMTVRVERSESSTIELVIGPPIDGLHPVRRSDRAPLYAIRIPTGRLVTRGFGLSW